MYQLYGFVVGAIVPVFLWLIHKKWPKLRADLVSVPVFGDTFENYYGNLSNYIFTWFILGTVNHMYFKRCELPVFLPNPSPLFLTS